MDKVLQFGLGGLVLGDFFFFLAGGWGFLGFGFFLLVGVFLFYFFY